MLRRATRPLLRHAIAAADAAAGGVQQHAPAQQQWRTAAAAGGVVRRWMASEPTPSTKEAVERTIVVNTLDLVRALARAACAQMSAC